MNVEADSCSHSLAVVLCDGTVSFAVTNLGPAPKLTPAGRIKRTRAEIQAEAQRKRDELQAKRDRKAAGRLVAKRAKATAKQLRADARRERSRAAEMKRIERERKQRDREISGRHVITPKPETPRRVFAERLQDDPEKAFSNHIVDPIWDSEDTFVEFLDEQRTPVPAQPSLEELLFEKVLDGTADLADLVTLLALDSDNEQSVEGIIDDLFFTEEEDYSWFAYTDEDVAIERMPRWTGHWDDERQPTRLGRRGRNITVIRQRCPHSGKVIVEVPKPMLRTSKDLLIAAK